MRFLLRFSGASKVIAGHAHAVLLMRRIFTGIRCWTVHVVLDVGVVVSGDASPLFWHVFVDAGLAAIVAVASRRRANGHRIAAVVTRQSARNGRDQRVRWDQGTENIESVSYDGFRVLLLIVTSFLLYSVLLVVFPCAVHARQNRFDRVF